MPATKPAQREQTVNCDDGLHRKCYGYIGPLVYSNTRPCDCLCHEQGNPRDFARAVARANRSFYSGQS